MWRQQCHYHGVDLLAQLRKGAHKQTA
uniref:Uncharacterized protein n=1 Tax=Arundo donax TaxID=35708 RepID=A0A0A8ZPY1_ARUDO